MMPAPDVPALVELVRAGDIAADRSLTAAAAGGDLEAQRGILTLMVGDDVHALSIAVLCRAELMARLAAMRGDPYDRKRLVAVLCALALKMREGGWDFSSYTNEAARALLSLSDEGDGHATAQIANFAADFPDAWNGAQLSAEPRADALPPLIVTTPVPAIGDLLEQAFAPLPSARDGKVRGFIRNWLWRIAVALDARLDRK